MKILCTLRDIDSSLDVFAYHLLPRSITKTCTDIVNVDPHTAGGTHRLAVHFRSKYSSVYYFDSYGIAPFVPDILAFIRPNGTTWDNNQRQLQDLTSDVCGKYCCLYAPTRFGATVPNNSSRSSTHVTWTGRWMGGSRPNAAWRLGSMLPQLHIKGNYFIASCHS